MVSFKKEKPVRSLFSGLTGFLYSVVLQVIGSDLPQLPYSLRNDFTGLAIEAFMA